jgi:hypothetical protein
MTVFSIEYRVIGYSLSDGMRPDPKWGKKGFTVKSEDMGTEDIHEIVTAAQYPDAIPKGYKLFSVRNIATGEQVKP